MKKIIKNLFLVFVIALMAVTCFAACDMIGDLIGGSSSSNNCNHDFVEVHRDANCMHGGVVVLECRKCGRIQETSIGPTEHEPVVEEGHPADCYNDGLADGLVCKFCGQTLEEQQRIPASHIFVTIEAVEATCTENGRTEGKECSVCGYVETSSQTIYASHDIVYVVGVEPTCTTPGKTECYKCTKCDYVESGEYEIPPAHKIEYIEEIYPTCTSVGWTYGEKCSVCEMVVVEPEEIPMVEHSLHTTTWGYSNTCTQDGLTDELRCYYCDYVEPQEIIPAGHTEKVVEGYDATCNAIGKTDGSECSVCGEVIIAQIEIAKLPHTIVEQSGYPATCTSTGLSDGQSCSVCGQVVKAQHTIHSEGHVFGTDGNCTGCELSVTPELTYEEKISLLRSASGTQYIVTGLTADFNGTVIVIPNTYNGCPVVGIAENAFVNQSTVTKVVIPKSITEVGDNAFDGCSALESVECNDFAQMENWSEYWCGSSTPKINAIVSHGQSPYEIYIDAMNKVNHNFTNYTWNYTSNIYWAISDASYGIPYGTLATSMYTTQMQNGDDWYYYHSETDHMSGGAQTSESFYYVDGYYYLLQNSDWYKLPMSKEYMLSVTSMNTASIKLLPEHFKDVVFYKDTNGMMYLELYMDPILFTELISQVSGQVIPGIISDPVYTYVIDANGNLESYGYTSGVQGALTQDGPLQTIMELEVKAQFSDINSTNIYAPSYSIDAYVPNCNGNHTVVEVEAVEGTCYMNGTSAYSYCSRCYQVITSMTTIEACHEYVNGECVECGTFEDPLTSVGLDYVLNSDETGYILVGMGGCIDTTVYVPSYVYGLPVVEISADAFDGTDVYEIAIAGNWYLVEQFSGWTAA